MLTGAIDIEGHPSRLFERLITEEDVGMARDALERLIGDGNARVSVSMNLSDKAFGSGFGTQVSVSLNVDQRTDAVDDGFQIAKGLALQYTEDAFEEAKDLAQTLLKA